MDVRKIVGEAPKYATHYRAEDRKYYRYDSLYAHWEEYWDIPNAPMWQVVYNHYEPLNLFLLQELKKGLDYE